MIERVLCLLFGHTKSKGLSDTNMQIKPSSALGFFKVVYCMRCRQLYTEEVITLPKKYRNTKKEIERFLEFLENAHIAQLDPEHSATDGKVAGSSPVVGTCK